MEPPEIQQLLEVCMKAARTAGDHALKNIHRREEALETFDHDIKLVMDRECQTIAEQIIHSSFPDHAILGEEGAIETPHDFEWIIDPIDGTANYTRGIPAWCCSIAVRHLDSVLAGCVYVPVLNECFTATQTGPALLNGEPIRVSDVQTLEKATFFGGLTKDIDPKAVGLFCELAPRVNKIRMIGCAAIDTCHVACGRSDGYCEPGLYIWDIAAAGLIAQRAGAVITEWERDEPNGVRFLCTTPAIHNDLREIVEQHFDK
ncbi:MAG: inositol monophosphatase [Kiritimatiellales bacterium]|nr:inositol monophosphatase [Kiritimatiellota bacterium]MBL7011882.1 inositol monophosphatase [Kiritimatiellales bacterium]